MKKLFFAVMISGLLFFNGCARESNRISVAPFSANAEIIDGDVVLEGNITCNGHGDVIFEIKRPDELEGVMLTVCGENTGISFDGVEAEASFKGVMYKLSRGLSSLREAAEEGLYRSSSEVTCGEFTYVFDEGKNSLSSVYKDNFRCSFIY